MTRELFTNPPTPGVAAPLATLAAPITTTPAQGTQENYAVSAAAPTNLRSADGQFHVLIDNEIMTVAASATGASPWTFTRGVDGTATATHANGAQIWFMIPMGVFQKFMQSGPPARAYRNAAFTTITGAFTAIPLDTADGDPGGMLSGGGLIVPEAGYYDVTGSVQVGAGSSPSTLGVGIGVAGVVRQAQVVAPSAIYAMTALVRGRIQCAANDKMQLWIQSNQTSLNIPNPANLGNYLEVQRVY